MFAVTLAGCVVGPDYHPPNAPSVERYTAQPLPATTGAISGITAGHAQHFAPGADLPAEWWALFHSEALNHLVAAALKANPDLAAAQAALRVAQENYRAAGGALWPALNGVLQAQRQRTPGALFGQPRFPGSIYTLYQAQAQVSYVPDVFGGTHRTIEREGATVDYARMELEAARLSLTANVVATAVQVAALNQQIAAQHAIIDAYVESAGILRRQVELGGASQAARQQLLTLLAQARAGLPPMQRQRAAAQNLLATLTGHFPSEMPALDIQLDNLALPNTLPVSLPSRLVEQRPDIQAASARLHEASAAVGIAIANRLPQITLTANLGTLATHPEDLFSPGGGLWNFGAALTQPIFKGGELLHRQRAAQASFEQAKAQYRSTVLTAFRDVADTLQALQTDADALRTQRAAQQAAGQLLEIAKGQYQAGGLTYPGVLEAGLAWQRARIATIQAQAARYSDTAALFQALGGGWWNRADTAVASTAQVAQPISTTP